MNYNVSNKSKFVEVIYMAKHEFGIMMDAPQQGKRYDEYEPGKYTCISVDNAYWKALLKDFHPLTSIGIHFLSKVRDLHIMVLHLFHLAH